MHNLLAVYERSLFAQLADSTETKRLAFRLRYQVYCRERAYERIDGYPEQMETDAYDDHALHLLVRSQANGAPVGVARLVRDAAGGRGSLPIESHGSRSVSAHLSRLRSAGSGGIAEVSRVAVTKGLKSITRRSPGANVALRRQAESTAGAESPSLSSRHVSMGLLALMLTQSWRHDITHWTALIDSSLLRFLPWLGIGCQPIGTVIDHRGQRQPVVVAVSDVWAGIVEHCTPAALLTRRIAGPALVPDGQPVTKKPLAVPRPGI